MTIKMLLYGGVMVEASAYTLNCSFKTLNMCKYHGRIKSINIFSPENNRQVCYELPSNCNITDDEFINKLNIIIKERVSPRGYSQLPLNVVRDLSSLYDCVFDIMKVLNEDNFSSFNTGNSFTKSYDYFKEVVI